MHFLKTPLFRYALFQKAEPNSPEVEEDLSWSHKSLDGVFRSFIGSSGVRVPYLGPQYVSPIFLFKN